MYIEIEQAIVPRLCKRCGNIIPVRGLCINIAGQIQNRPIKFDVCSKCVDELKFTIDNWSTRSEEIKMAWRPHEFLIEGELDNTVPGKVTGWMKFAGIKETVQFELRGNFHRDIRGAKFRFKGDAYGNAATAEAENYMQGFAVKQTGKVGDITAGLPPADYVSYPYIEWYSDANGRVVVELEPDQVEVIGMPIPAIESDPVCRSEQRNNLNDFLKGLAREMKLPLDSIIIVGSNSTGESASSSLLTPELRQRLPKLYCQEHVNDPIAQARFFTPDSNWSWYPVEFDGEDLFFGLVIGFEREIGYFRLSELENCRGPLGLRIERDVHFVPTSLSQIKMEDDHR